MPVAEAVGRQWKNISLLWNKPEYGQQKGDISVMHRQPVQTQAGDFIWLPAVEQFTAMVQSSTHLPKTTFFQAKFMPGTFI